MFMDNLNGVNTKNDQLDGSKSVVFLFLLVSELSPKQDERTMTLRANTAFSYFLS